MDQGVEGMNQYIHIDQNDFVHRKHKKQKEEDIAICECIYDPSNPESACGERCLNMLTSTECTPGYCRSGEYCRNQRFQRKQYAKVKLFKTEGRGCGLLADENIKAGQFVIEYCGEVISWKEARRRSFTYEKLGQKDAFIISLDATESIDATRKGSLARFINHSCQPNCETRKWTVLGEVRVGIFAKQDIMIGTELAYDYNFEWYGGTKVRCLCGASICSGFLGAKSRGFQEDTYLWEDDDDRYSVEKIPLYDSAEDEPTSKLQKTVDTNYNMDVKIDFSINSNFNLDSKETEGAVMNSTSTQINASSSMKTESLTVSQTKNKNGGGMNKKRSKLFTNGKPKALVQKQLDVKLVARLLAPKEAQNEVLNYEEMKNEATSELESLYNEIRPAIEEHERDNQDSVATSVAEKWIQASCLKLKSEFDLYSSVIKHMVLTPRRAELPPPDDSKNEVKLLTFGPSSDDQKPT